MKKENIILNTIIIILVALILVQSSFLWVEIPKKEQSISSSQSQSAEELFVEVLKPQKIILNFGENRHTILSDFDEIYQDYLDVIFNIFNETTEENLTSITTEEYLLLQQERSIVFDFNKVITSNIFINLLGISNNQNKADKTFQIESIYISDSNLIIGSSKGFFRSNLSVNKNIAPTLSSVESQGYSNYNNFSEIYGINKNLLIPQKSYIKVKDVYYSSNFSLMEKDTMNNLAENFLNQNIDYIREITQDNGTTFLYEDKFLILNNDSTIYYKNSENIEETERNLYISLKSAINFIANKIGSVEDLYLAKVQPIEDRGNVGYKFAFNISENSTPVNINNSDTYNYIDIEVYSDKIKTYKQIYRQVKKEPEISYSNIRILPLETIVLKNKNLFVSEDSTLTEFDIISGISDVNFVYLYDFPEDDFTKLSTVLKINYDNRELFFSVESGKFIMER